MVIDGILINILNPKLSIFFVAFLPQFIAAGEPSPLLRMLELSGVFMAMTFVIFAIYGLFAAAMRDHVDQPPGGDGLDAPHLRGRLRRARCEAGADRAVSIGPSCPRLSRASTT